MADYIDSIFTRPTTDQPPTVSEHLRDMLRKVDNVKIAADQLDIGSWQSAFIHMEKEFTDLGHCTR
jgi:hypothetical protein